MLYPDDQHINLLRYSSEDAEAVAIAIGIARAPVEKRGEVAVLARTRALLERMHTALVEAGVNAAIAQRRDDFRSPQFLWLAAAFRLASRPLDRRALDTLTGAFNRWFGTDALSDDIAAASEISGRSLLTEWSASIAAMPTDQARTFAAKAKTLGDQPSSFRNFMDEFIAGLPPEGGDDTIDIEEDRAAWNALVRSIGKAVGRDAPLEQFLQELGLRSKEPPVGPNTVTLMTIHGAKGKEFDHVYVIGLAEDVLPSFQSVKAGEQSAEMEEERRNCFVAITRAREWLCLSYADQYRGWAKQPSRFLTEMGLSLPQDPAS
tara:strand:- start:6039 stop:6995 length:957 start_codon:yes stop_codon:yes gene_type:complete